MSIGMMSNQAVWWWVWQSMQNNKRHGHDSMLSNTILPPEMANAKLPHNRKWTHTN